jgi:membrane protease YdiL (CAAX protease family)
MEIENHEPEEAEPRSTAPEPKDPDGSELAVSAFVRFGLYFYGAMIAVALVWRMGLYDESILFSSPAAELAGARPLRDTAIGIGVGLAVVLASEVATRLTGWGDALARELAVAIGPISVPNSLLLAMASGLGEELFFRGALQPRVGLVFASLAFGAMHFVPRRELWPWTGFALVVGLLFGALFEWTGSVIAPVIAHTVVNGINLPLLVRRHGSAH